MSNLVTIRAATPHDDQTLTRLARLDSHTNLQGAALLAERDDVPIAAIALSSGSVVSDPFEATSGAVALLRARRYRLLRQGGDVGRAPSLLRRLAPQPATQGA